MSAGALRIAVIGVGGRMGQAVVRAAVEAGHRIVGAVDRPGSASLGRDAGDLAAAGHAGVEVSADLSAGLLGADCVIDFSTADAVPAVAAAAGRAKVALVSGTTGIGPEAERALSDAALRAPVLWSPNMSIGVHVLAEIVKAAVRALPAYDVEIVEAHHRAKVDAPSGTAKRLFEAVREVREARAVSGREGRPGARLADEVAVLAMRGGDVIGDHTVHLLGPGERLELTHRATSRELFARGAVRAAEAIARRPAGRYSMADVVGA